jgi:hypothetical protein
MDKVWDHLELQLHPNYKKEIRKRVTTMVPFISANFPKANGMVMVYGLARRRSIRESGTWTSAMAKVSRLGKMVEYTQGASKMDSFTGKAVWSGKLQKG